MDDLNSNSTNATGDLLGQIMCLKKARLILTDIGLVITDDSELDNYKQNVDTLIYILKLYMDDIRSLKGFYQ